MTKKFLFGMMSLAMFAACTNDDFESTKVADGKAPVKFVVVNNDASTRATMDGNALKFSAKDGDLFTLYHGATANQNSGFQNATYKASEGEGAAVLTTPSMILPGQAIMVYPADLTFRVKNSDDISIVIPEEIDDVAKYFPWVSDGINIIGTYGNANDALSTDKNTLGYQKEYPIYMRPMASQLNLKTDYAGTTELLQPLYELAEDPCEPIKVTSISVSTAEAGSTKFTTGIKLDLTTATDWNSKASWKDATVDPAEALYGNNWNAVTTVDANTAANIVSSAAVLKSKSLNGNDGCKLLFLPQADIATEVADGAVIVDTYYGKVVVGESGVGGAYTAQEIADAWYRYVSAGTTSTYDEILTEKTNSEGKFKMTSEPKKGMAQTINMFGDKVADGGVIEGEQVGAATTRYVKVLLSHLDMSDLHITSDKQLRDVVRAWKLLNHADVTVILDGDEDDEVFEMSQKTIETINAINAEKGKLAFKVMPCTVTKEACSTIKIVGGGDVQDIAFIADNSGTKVDVELAEDYTWKWNGTVKVDANAVSKIINEGTMENAATATLKTTENDDTQNNVPFENNGTWNINAPATLNVQFDVTNNGTVNIAKGAQYRQDGYGSTKTTFTNEASTLPQRFLAEDETEEIGLVNNYGVFGCIGGKGEINNYGLIEHLDKDAKTLITTNQFTGNFSTAFGDTNKMGTINLPFENKDEDNISISAGLAEGFVSVTVNNNGKTLDASVVGPRVNYINVIGGVESISSVSANVKYLEINQPGTEVVWAVTAPTKYQGLILLSDVNIKLNSIITSVVTYLDADMYVAGRFNKDALSIDTNNDGNADFSSAATAWNGYFGETSGNVGTKYITF